MLLGVLFFFMVVVGSSVFGLYHRFFDGIV